MTKTVSLGHMKLVTGSGVTILQQLVLNLALDGLGYILLWKLSNLRYLLQKSAHSPVLNISVDGMKPYEGRNQPQSWLHDQDDTIVSGPLNSSLGHQSDIMQASENSN